MKIGILTLWNAEDNYGQILQCYALQAFLRQQGHDAFLICYQPPKNQLYTRILSQPLKLIKAIINPAFLIESLKYRKRIKQTKIVNAKHPRYFNKFRDKYIKSTHIYTQKQLFVNPPNADMYICGSDQVWNGMDPIFYLNFGKPEIKRMSYAASFGKIKLNKKEVQIIMPWIRKIDVITVRENSAINICHILGRKDAICVPDPTLLLSKEVYNKLINQPAINGEKYILLYLLGNQMDFKLSELYQYASTKGLQVKYIASQGRIDTYTKEYPTVEGWLNLIKNASYIVTNSFHGSVFSILFNKKFLVIPLSGGYTGMNTRITSLLQKYHLMEHLYSGKINAIESEISYNKINEIISKEQQEMISLFQHIIH